MAHGCRLLPKATRAMNCRPLAISHQPSAIEMRLGLIAGNGRFPFLILDAARAAGHDVTIIALKEEAFPDLEAAAAQAPSATLHRVSLGQLGTWVNVLKKAHVTHAVMAGQVKHTRLFSDIVPDM